MARDWGGAVTVLLVPPEPPGDAARITHTHSPGMSQHVPAPERFFSPLLNCSPVCRLRVCVPVIPSGSGGTLRMEEVNSHQTVQGRRGQAGGSGCRRPVLLLRPRVSETSPSPRGEGASARVRVQCRRVRGSCAGGDTRSPASPGEDAVSAPAAPDPRDPLAGPGRRAGLKFRLFFQIREGF